MSKEKNRETQNAIINARLAPTLLSQLKMTRDPAIILRMNALTNAPKEEILASLDQILDGQQSDAGGQGVQ